MFPGEIPGRSRLALLGRRRGEGRALRKGRRWFVTKVNLFYSGQRGNHDDHHGDRRGLGRVGKPVHTDNDRVNDKRVAIEAVRDYFNDGLSKEEPIAIIRLYFASSS